MTEKPQLAGYEIKEKKTWHFGGFEFTSEDAARRAAFAEWLTNNAGMCTKCNKAAAIAIMKDAYPVGILLGIVKP